MLCINNNNTNLIQRGVLILRLDKNVSLWESDCLIGSENTNTNKNMTISKNEKDGISKNESICRESIYTNMLQPLDILNNLETQECVIYDIAFNIDVDMTE